MLDHAQRNYCTKRKELLAVLRFTKHFKLYLLWRDFTVRTDHSSLTWLIGFKNIERQLTGWIEELSMYNMQIVHRTESKHVNDDGLSRIPDPLTQCNCYSAGSNVEDLPCGGCEYCVRAHSNWEQFYNDDDIAHLAIRHVSNDATDKVPEDNLTWVERYRVEDIWKQQLDDEITSQMIKWLESDQILTQAELALCSPVIKYFWLHRHQLLMVCGVLYFERVEKQKRGPDDEVMGLLVAPESLQRVFLEHWNDKHGAGHMGMNKTAERVRRNAVWYKIIESCQVCNRQKKPHIKIKAHHVSYHAGSPKERIHINILGPLVETPRGNQYGFVVVDQFSK